LSKETIGEARRKRPTANVPGLIKLPHDERTYDLTSTS
jgi:hypothetical protein